MHAPAPGTACFELSGDLEWLHTAAAHAKHVIDHHVNQGQVRRAVGDLSRSQITSDV